MNAKATWRDPELGPVRTAELSTATIRYHDRGTGPVIVFVHGLLVNANLWRKVVPVLARDFRCITLDMPFGSHLVPVPDIDLSPHGAADLIADAIVALDLDHVTLVGNDSGGAIAQMVVTRRPERIGRLVLTSCDAFQLFPPAMFKPLLVGARVPGFVAVLTNAMRLHAPRRLPAAFGWLTHAPIDRDAEDSYVLPAAQSAAIRKDTARFLRGIDSRYTLEAGELLKDLEIPALLAWSKDDRFFKSELVERLERTIPNARIEWIPRARTFSPEDNPTALAAAIGAFAREPVAASV